MTTEPTTVSSTVQFHTRALSGGIPSVEKKKEISNDGKGTVVKLPEPVEMKVGGKVKKVSNIGRNLALGIGVTILAAAVAVFVLMAFPILVKAVVLGLGILSCAALAIVAIKLHKKKSNPSSDVKDQMKELAAALELSNKLEQANKKKKAPALPEHVVSEFGTPEVQVIPAPAPVAKIVPSHLAIQDVKLAKEIMGSVEVAAERAVASVKKLQVAKQNADVNPDGLKQAKIEVVRNIKALCAAYVEDRVLNGAKNAETRLTEILGKETITYGKGDKFNGREISIMELVLVGVSAENISPQLKNDLDGIGYGVFGSGEPAQVYSSIINKFATTVRNSTVLEALDNLAKHTKNACTGSIEASVTTKGLTAAISASYKTKFDHLVGATARDLLNDMDDLNIPRDSHDGKLAYIASELVRVGALADSDAFIRTVSVELDVKEAKLGSVKAQAEAEAAAVVAKIEAEKQAKEVAELNSELTVSLALANKLELQLLELYRYLKENIAIANLSGPETSTLGNHSRFGASMKENLSTISTVLSQNLPKARSDAKANIEIIKKEIAEVEMEIKAQQQVIETLLADLKEIGQVVAGTVPSQADTEIGMLKEETASVKNADSMPFLSLFKGAGKADPLGPVTKEELAFNALMNEPKVEDQLVEVVNLNPTPLPLSGSGLSYFDGVTSSALFSGLDLVSKELMAKELEKASLPQAPKPVAAEVSSPVAEPRRLVIGPRVRSNSVPLVGKEIVASVNDQIAFEQGMMMGAMLMASNLQAPVPQSSVKITEVDSDTEETFDSRGKTVQGAASAERLNLASVNLNNLMD